MQFLQEFKVMLNHDALGTLLIQVLPAALDVGHKVRQAGRPHVHLLACLLELALEDGWGGGGGRARGGNEGSGAEYEEEEPGREGQEGSGGHPT